MPPRISRLKWPRLFPRFEPPPFLYPRPFTVEAANPTPLPQGQPEPAEAQEQNELNEEELDVTRQPERHRDHEQAREKDARIPPVVKRKAEVRQLQEKRRRQLREKSFFAHDWRTPLALLRKHTPDDLNIHVKQLERLDMPHGTRGFYPGRLAGLFLEIYLHTGCHVQKLRDDKMTGDDFQALEMSGSVLSIKLARKMLNDAIQIKSDEDLNDRGKMGSYITTVTSIPSSTEPLPRAVWNVRNPSQIISRLEPPVVWRATTFSNYVQDLIMSVPGPRPRQNKKAAPVKPHLDVVAEKLVALFSDIASVRSASMYACVLALQYLAQHRKLPEVRQIFELLERRTSTIVSLQTIFASPAVFNVCLHAAAEAGDLHNYNFLLRMMLEKNTAPDHNTWAALLSLTQTVSPRNARHVISAMRTRNILASPAAKIAVANVTVRKDFAEWIGRGDSLYDFLSHYDRQWGGNEWLDTRATNIMLEALVSRGDFEDAMALLDIMINNRNRQPNLVTLHVLLGGAIVHKHLGFAQQSLEHTLGRFGHLEADQTTYDRLAKLAFEKRAHNILRVAWQHACMSGHVSSRFESIMKKSFLEAVPESSTTTVPGTGSSTDSLAGMSRPKFFKATAAKVSIGVPPPSSNDTAKSSYSRPSIYAAPDPNDGATPPRVLVKRAERELQKQQLGPLIRDIEMGRLFTPTKSLAEAFAEAVARDIEWGEEGLRKHADLDTLLERAVEVEVRKKASRDYYTQGLTTRIPVSRGDGVRKEADGKPDMYAEHRWLEVLLQQEIHTP